MERCFVEILANGIAHVFRTKNPDCKTVVHRSGCPDYFVDRFYRAISVNFTRKIPNKNYQKKTW